MIPVWRLVRNRHARRVYETLSALGVTVSRMVEYEVCLDDHHDGDTDVAVPAGVSFESAPATAGPVRAIDLDFSIPVTFLDNEWVIAATVGGEAVGRALVSVGQHPHVDPLGERMAFNGAYVRRVYVKPAWRNRGVARQLVAGTLSVARMELGADAASALVAPDNKPSRRVFVVTLVGTWNGWLATATVLAASPLMISEYRTPKTGTTHAILGGFAAVVTGVCLALEYGL